MTEKIFKLQKIIFALVFGAVFTVLLAAADPGSADDPLISRSYIDSVLMPQVKEAISQSSSFEVVSLPGGKTLICDAGCELIIRMGSALIVSTPKGGIADVTGGSDLPNGVSAPSNHLLIAPMGDGRGIAAKNDMLVMVKGGYKIQ